MKKGMIGIIVCAILLLTSPALASAGYSKIYGNANEDDVLDMRDVTYIKLVIFGKKPATTFADANHDGKVSMLDVGQTKLTILGKEKQLTLMDQADRVVTIKMPVERVVTMTKELARIIFYLGAEDKLVGVDRQTSPNGYYDPIIIQKVYPEIYEVPNVGSHKEPNKELILSLRPDVVFFPMSSESANALFDSTSIPVICVGTLGDVELIFKRFKLVSNVIGMEGRAEELISYAKEVISEVTEVTSEIPDDEKPKVYLAFWESITETPILYEPLIMAGGINVAQDAEKTWKYGAEISKEQIIAWNPDIILIHHFDKTATPTVEDVLSDPDLQTVNAIKNQKVYYTFGYSQGWDTTRTITEIPYTAKLFYPEKFEVLDIEKKGNEIFERFYGVDGLYTYLAEELGFGL